MYLKLLNMFFLFYDIDVKQVKYRVCILSMYNEVFRYLLD